MCTSLLFAFLYFSFYSPVRQNILKLTYFSNCQFFINWKKNYFKLTLYHCLDYILLLFLFQNIHISTFYCCWYTHCLGNEISIFILERKKLRKINSNINRWIKKWGVGWNSDNRRMIRLIFRIWIVFCSILKSIL